MYLTAVKATRILFWAALAAGFLGLLMPQIFWVALGLAAACGACFLSAVLHVRRTRRYELRCPQCGWAPFALNAWKCKECGFVWDFFATGGACPRCGHQHAEAACLQCRRIAPIERWEEARGG